MDVLRSIALFVLAAVAEIGGAWLVWQGVREQRGLVWIGAGSHLGRRRVNSAGLVGSRGCVLASIS